MHSRFLAGWKGLVLAAAVASLVLLPMTGALAAAGTEKPAGGAQGFASATGDPDRIKLPTLYPRANYQWPYATGPFYGAVENPQTPAKGVLRLAVGSFDASVGIPSIPQELRTTVKLDRQSSQYFLLQVDPATLGDGSFDRLRDGIVSGGGAVVESLSGGAFLVRLTAATYGVLQGQPGVQLVEPYHPAFRLSPYIGRVPLADPVKALSSVYSLDIQLFPGEDASAVAREIAALGGNVTAVWTDEIKADVNRDKLADVASLEPVKMVFESVPVWLWGEETTTTMQTGHWNLGAIPYHDAGINGGGNGLATAQVMMELDNGIQLDAGDLSDTFTSSGTPGLAHRKVSGYVATTAFGGSGDLLGCDAPPQGGTTHGQMVAATALGNGTATASGYGGTWYAPDPNTGRRWKLDGVAPKARLIAYDGQVTSSFTACGAVNATTTVGDLTPGNLYTPGQACANPVPATAGSLCDAYGFFAATASDPRTFVLAWGTSANPVYGTFASKVDSFLFDHNDAMVFIAAGDDSKDTDRNSIPDPGTVSDPASAKNAVVVGGADNANDGGL
ncbi:MAG: S8 family serine peptidase, partial [Acidobacteriia bacterium]|nr:S8 family serine peptidase [Terriglobia bacterium]